MTTVKLTTSDGVLSAERQTPRRSGVWGNYEFSVNSNLNVCDFWVIYDGVPYTQTVSCPPENVIFITGEPFGKWHYHQKFLKQFGLVVAFERKIKGTNVIYNQPSESWSVGRKTLSSPFTWGNIMTYDELKAIKSFKKDKLISVIVSNKAFYPYQVKRLEFVRKLSKLMDIDIFGTNINPLDDKWDALARYKYHIALESFVNPDYFTCKLTDAFLGGTYPFYSGAPNIQEYFPERSIAPININNFDSAYRTISRAIEYDTYEKSVKAISNARNKVLDEYNIFPSMVKIMDLMDANQQKKEITIKPAPFFQSFAIKVQWRIWTGLFLLRTKRKAEKAICELSHGKMKERKTH